MTWVHMLQSRWLVLGLKCCRLEVWDLGRGPDDAEYLVALEECLSGHVVSGVSYLAGEKVLLTVNTQYGHFQAHFANETNSYFLLLPPSDNVTYTFHVEVPSRNNGTEANPWSDIALKLLDISLDYCKILHTSEGLLAFDKSAEIDSPHIVSRFPEGCVRLARETDIDEVSPPTLVTA